MAVRDKARRVSTPCTRIAWRNVGASYWPDFRDCIAATIQVGGAADSASTFGAFASGDTTKGGVLAPNGCIYCVPYSIPTVLKIDPATDTTSTFGELAGSAKWSGGVLAPNGCIYGMKATATTILKIDPESEVAFSEQILLSGYFNKY